MGMTFKQDDTEETYEDYDAYAALNRKSILHKPFVPYIAAGIVALVVILGFTMFGTNSQSDALAEEVARLAKHLDDMEFRLANLEQASAGDESVATLSTNYDTLSRQFQALETKLGRNLNQLNSKIAALEKQQKSVAKPAAAPPKAKQAKVHVVKAGETLYQISRKYGLTVDQLTQLNNLGKNVTIKPGQKLNVGTK